jgi:hypothetical protein
VRAEDGGRQRAVLVQILRDYVGELWAAGEFQKLMVLEYLFVLGGRNKDAAQALRHRRREGRGRDQVPRRRAAAWHGAAARPESLPVPRPLATGGPMSADDDDAIDPEPRVHGGDGLARGAHLVPASAPAAELAAGWLAGGAGEFVQFHLRDSQCPYCNAVVEDLRAQRGTRPSRCSRTCAIGCCARPWPSCGARAPERFDFGGRGQVARERIVGCRRRRGGLGAKTRPGHLPTETT